MHFKREIKSTQQSFGGPVQISLKDATKVNDNNFISTEEFHASDLFKKWKKLINRAEETIHIFTPYLDSTLNKLLKNVDGKIEITIITALEGDNLFQRGYQIGALTKAIEEGAVVKHLPGLHAKVLVIDNKMISLGSQNFTRRGRSNKEAGIVSEVSFEGSEILLTLKIWESESVEVDIELLEELLSFLEEKEEAIADLKDEFDDGIQSILKNFTQRMEEQRVHSYYTGTLRSDQRFAFLVKTCPPPNYDYFSFFAGEHNNLCKWKIASPEGQEEHINLEDYCYYPALNVNTMRMAYLRVHTSRITFMKSAYYGFYQIGEITYKIDFTMPKSKTKRWNIKIVIKDPTTTAKASLFYLFNGKELFLVKEDYSDKSIKRIIKADLSSRKERNLLNYIMEPYKFKTPAHYPRHIETFLPKDTYKVELLKFNGIPVFLMKDFS